ncbi:hypothetical protein E4198_15000 [Streptomyces sp. RKND-216]|uniref:hypothetical protein n=1 Tax=Streptomyces sp. RKND-216 TaxID=2562581 RepID=UPI00109D9F0B|nr:hypothetical protein [Streptomyces sp. RKND-216]THA25831.1 hypothetical protein E4198_15000 [Streptomyces sp. RKND-216]
MEPRDLWERNSLLAEAFCASDDEVRHAQRILDEAQANRTRILAAFAVTVGSDGGVADLMGLNEREVRLARRTVGKDDARSVAKRLLTCDAQLRQEAATEQAPAPEETPHAPPPEPRTEEPPAPSQAPHPPHVPHPETVAWSPAMDSVLLWSWQSGLDLTTVALELGLSPRDLLLRAQALAAEGRLTLRPSEDFGQTGGRHRREGLEVSVPDSPQDLYSLAYQT